MGKASFDRNLIVRVVCGDLALQFGDFSSVRVEVGDLGSVVPPLKEVVENKAGFNSLTEVAEGCYRA